MADSPSRDPRNPRPARDAGPTAAPVEPARLFPSAQEDAAIAAVETTPSPYEGPGSAYRLAFTDTEFLLREELRPVRMQLELLKPELIQNEHGIEQTVVFFGSARILAPEDAARELEAARVDGTPAQLREAEMRVGMSRYYEEARRLAGLVTRHTRHLERPLYVVTGGGPGIMEAGNRGAHEAGGKSIGLNIVLAREQVPNPFITPELCFQFHYFALRKMHFLMRAVAIVCFPGGFGTLDETFEALTLVQTGKARRRPILLFGRDFWTGLVNFDQLVETGMISPEDVHRFHFVETAEEAWALLAAEHGETEPAIGAYAVDV